MSLTFPAPAHEVSSILHVIEDDELDVLDQYWEENGLCTLSRNNWLEFHLHALLQSLGTHEIAYLGTSIREIADRSVSTTVLCDEALSYAVSGIQAFIATIQARALDCAELLSAPFAAYDANDILESFANPPDSIQEAIDHFAVCSDANEGDDLPTLAAFLYAHWFILTTAQKNNMSVVYAVWLY